MFITFEGLDFSGKTTQAKLLVEKLQRLNHTVHFIREPGGTKISERVREILLDRKHLEMSPTAEIFLFSAARSQLVRDVIAPALKRREIVVCDRYYDSTTAYQGYGRGVDLDAVRTINQLASSGVTPDLTLLIDIPVEEISRRKGKAGLTFDRMESSGKDFYERVRDGYRNIGLTAPERFVCVDGTGPIEHVHRELWRAVEQKLATKTTRLQNTSSTHL